YLRDLAERDPEELENLRLREIESLIENAPEHMRRRLRGLQFQIDCTRRLHPTPLGACIAISQIMMDSLCKLNQSLHQEGNYSKQRSSPASVIPFGQINQTSSRGHAP